jgi:hypothetical protein
MTKDETDRQVDEIGVLLNAAMLARKFNWLRALICSLVAASVALVGATWLVRDYLDSVRRDIRVEIHSAIEPLSQTQRDQWVEIREHHDFIVMLQARQAVAP